MARILKGPRCPRCGSTNVKKDYYLGADTGDYHCNGCGYESPRSWDEWYEQVEPADDRVDKQT